MHCRAVPEVLSINGGRPLTGTNGADVGPNDPAKSHGPVITSCAVMGMTERDIQLRVGTKCQVKQRIRAYW